MGGLVNSSPKKITAVYTASNKLAIRKNSGKGRLLKKHLVFSILVLGLVFPLLAAATSPTLPPDCEARLAIKPELPLTLPFLSSAAREDIKVARVIQPKRNYFDLDGEMRITRHGVNGPKALQTMIGQNLKFMAVPSAQSPTDITVGDPENGITLPLRLDTTWQGQPAGTLLYLSLPQTLSPVQSDYIIGPQYEYLDIQLHGGGTQHARAENSTSLGIPLGKRNIAVMGIDLPGHGDGPAGDILTSEHICDWLMDIINKTVHPNVKITLSGHSWGAMLAVYLRNHSDNPKYARIRNAIAISPGVDVTLGGDIKKKLEFDQWYGDHYHEFKDRIAEGDYEFLQTSIENDKLSILGAYATVASNLDYTTPVMTEEQQEKLIDILIITGKADGLVYVGREEQYQQAWGNLKKGSALVLLDPGTTFKSNGQKVKTGHQVFDLQIPGTSTQLVYKLVGDTIEKDQERNTQSDENEVQSEEATASNNEPADKSKEALEKKRLRNISILNEITREYAHFFPFRKLVENFVRYRRVPTPHLKDVAGRKRALDEFSNKITAVTAKNHQERTKALQERMAILRGEVGITERLDLIRAQEELSFPPLTDERKAVLKTFIERAAKIEEELKAEGDDQIHKDAVAKLWNTHSEFLFLQGVQELSGYRTLLSKYETMSKKTLTPEQKKIRTQLASIDQEYKNLENAKAARFGVERIRRIEEFGAPHGLKDPKAANRELLTPRSDERRAKVQLYVERYPAAEAEVHAKYDKILQDEIDKLPKPEGIQTLEEARVAAINQEALLNMMYPIPEQPEIQAIATNIQSVIAEKDLVQKGENGNATLDKLEQSLRDLKAEREKLIKRWESLVKEQLLTSDKIEAQRDLYAKDLSYLKETQHAMAAAIDAYLYEKFITFKTVTKEMILLRPQSLRDLEKTFMNARLKFHATQQTLHSLYLSEALANNLKGSHAEEAKLLARELHTQNPFSLTSRMQALDGRVEQLRETESILAQKKERLIWQYAQLLKQKGIAAPYDIERIEVYNLLDQPLEQLLERMENDQALVEALQDLLNTWKPLAKKLRSESQLSDTY